MWKKEYKKKRERKVKEITFGLSIYPKGFRAKCKQTEEK